MEWDFSDQFIDSLITEYFDELDREADSFIPRGSRRRPVSAARVGPYKRVAGHHVHQSASYGRGGSARRTNPHHREALAIGHGPGFNRAQHRRADSVQRRVNRALHGRRFRDDPTNPVRVTSRGDGRLPPTPNPWVEDLKAYYGLRAARPRGYDRPNTALELVMRSARDLERSGIRPQRIPTHGRK